ncbi:MAG: hypothetical protein WAW15_01995 [Minisyncoccales bacterium]
MKNWIKIFIIILCLFIGPSLFSLLIKEEPAPTPVNEGVVAKVKKVVDTSNWNEYINTQLRFSMKIPLEVPTLYRCDENQGGSTPLKVFEDNQSGAIYISQEYYYDANWSQPEQRFIGECDKITYSLESLKKEEEGYSLAGRSSHPFLGWKIIINNPKDDNEIIKYVKENFGSGCIISDRTLQKDSNYKISLAPEEEGKDGEAWWGSCALNFAYTILYSPEKQKMLSLILGQECTFQSFPDMSQCYDDKIVESFKFE